MHYLYKICSSKFFKPITLAVLLTTLGLGMLLDVQAVHAQTEITVTKDALNLDAYDFKFIATIPGSPSQTHFLGNNESFTIDVGAGTYTISEDYRAYIGGAVAAGAPRWIRTGMECDGGTITYNYSGGIVSSVFTPGYAGGINITIADGQSDINCTFTNRLHGDYPHGGVTIAKACDGATTTEPFSFNATNGIPGNSFELKCGEERGIDYLPPATPLTFEEQALPSGWSLESISCVDDDTLDPYSGATVSGNSVEIILPAGEDITCTFTNEEDTAITLASFDAAATPNGTTVTWTTAAEIDNAGFNVYGGSTATGPWTKLNSDLISAEGGLAGSTSYQFVDASNSAFYMLEDVDTSGVTTQHGPIGVSSRTADASTPLFSLFLPLLQQQF